MKHNSHITVFGATGRIGSELLRLLSAEKMPVIAVTRNKNNAASLPFVTWVEADMNNRESLQATMTDSKSVFLVSGANESLVTGQCNVIDAAAAQNVQHLVKLSSMTADPDSRLFIARAHGHIEEHLKGSGIAATILRPTGFMQNWLGGLLHTVKTQRKIFEATGAGKRAYIDLLDIAEVAFNVLLHPDKHTAHTYTLTGEEGVNYTQVAALLTTATGEQVAYIPITPEVAEQQMKDKGLPEWAIETFLAYAAEQRNGMAGIISSDVRDILKKPARTVAAFIEEYAPLFK